APGASATARCSSCPPRGTNRWSFDDSDDPNVSTFPPHIADTTRKAGFRLVRGWAMRKRLAAVRLSVSFGANIADAQPQPPAPPLSRPQPPAGPPHASPQPPPSPPVPPRPPFPAPGFPRTPPLPGPLPPSHPLPPRTLPPALLPPLTPPTPGAVRPG